MQVRQIMSLTAGAALAGGIGVVPVAAPSYLAAVVAFDVQLTAQDIVIDFVRHAQMTPPYDLLLTPSPDHPGAPLSDLGHRQADEVGQQLFTELGPVAGIFTGQGVRVAETSVPFADLEGTGGTSADVQILPGLDEVDSGIYALDPIESLGGRIAFLTVGAWSLGAPLGLALLQAPGSHDVNGVVLDDRFGDAVQTMYNHALDTGVVSANGQLTDVAFSSTASIFAWVIQNVDNPDLPFFLNLIKEANSLPNGQTTIFLPNTAVVEVRGNPTDGWTLVSWDGQAIPQTPDLLSGLFVDARDLVLPSQTAMWDIYEAVLGGDQATISATISAGFEQIGAALSHFPGAVLQTFADALGATDLLAGL